VINRTKGLLEARRAILPDVNKPVGKRLAFAAEPIMQVTKGFGNCTDHIHMKFKS
jgi:hypothetical protein